MHNTVTAAICGITFLLAAHLADGRTISFSGYQWSVKNSSRRLGPGPNLFSDSAGNVWVDASGRLHLKITHNKTKWYCAEVICLNSFGHGTYRFYLDSAVDNLDPNVVLGLFTWSDNSAYNNREIDIEFSRWGAANNLNAQYVVQPYTDPLNILRFNQPAGYPQTTHGFAWSAGSVAFQSVIGHTLPPPGQGYVIEEWTGTNSVPVPGDENPRINLWLFRGSKPGDGKEVEIIIKRFEFIPPTP